MNAAAPAPTPESLLPGRRPRTLAQVLVTALEERIRDGRLVPGVKLPTEAEIMGEFGVSRTVVREAISRLQAAALVNTRHGVGTFVAEKIDEPAFRILPQQLATLHDVIALLELRIGIETEAAALAAQRRGDEQIVTLRGLVAQIAQAIEADQDTVAADYQFHLEIARATQNGHYVQLIGALGSGIIPRARLAEDDAEARQRQRVFLRRVNAEHEAIVEAIAAGDAEGARAAMRMHLSNSRERRRWSLVT
ncbi:MAG: hypothetical protein RIQ53_1103 [Pseudomonadota bacterium]